MIQTRISHKINIYGNIKTYNGQKRACQDGRYPIVLRLTSLSLSTTIKTEVRLRLKEWDSRKNKVTKVHPEHASLNVHLKNKLFEHEKKLIDINFQSLGTNITFWKIEKKRVMRSTGF